MNAVSPVGTTARYDDTRLTNRTISQDMNHCDFSNGWISVVADCIFDEFCHFFQGHANVSFIGEFDNNLALKIVPGNPNKSRHSPTRWIGRYKLVTFLQSREGFRYDQEESGVVRHDSGGDVTAAYV